jgi:hypothetical protein
VMLTTMVMDDPEPLEPAVGAGLGKSFARICLSFVPGSKAWMTPHSQT